MACTLAIGCVGDPGDSANRPLTCRADADCELGEHCAEPACVAFDGPDVKYWTARGGELRPVADGGGMPVFVGFQGGTNTVMTLRTRGFPTSEVVSSEILVTSVPTGQILNLVSQSRLFLAGLEGDFGEVEDVFVVLDFGTVDIATIVDREAILSITLTSSSDPSVTAALEQRVRFIDGGAG